MPDSDLVNIRKGIGAKYLDSEATSRVISALYDGCNHRGREYFLGEVFGDLPEREKVTESALRISEMPWLQGKGGKNYHSRLSVVTRKGRNEILRLLGSCDLRPTTTIDDDDDKFITDFGITALPKRIWKRIEENSIYGTHILGVRAFSEQLARSGLSRAFGKTEKMARMLKENNGIPLRLRPMDKGRIIAYEDGPVQLLDRASTMSGEYVAWNALPSAADKNPAGPLIEIYENGFLVGAPERLSHGGIEVPSEAIGNTADIGKIIVLNKYGQITTLDTTLN